MIKDVIAFVPARAGSTRIVKKNLMEIGGLPLFLRACYNLHQLLPKENIVVDSDDEMMLELAIKHGFSYIRRPDSLATNATDGNAFFMWETSNFPDAEIYIQHLPPMPFLSFKTIKSALEKVSQGGFDSIVAVGKKHYYTWDAVDLKPKYNIGNIPNSYTLEETVFESMGFYVITNKAHSISKMRIGNNYSFIDLPLIEQIDIDEMEDLELARAIEKGLPYNSPYKSRNLMLKDIMKSMKKCRTIFCDVDGVLTNGKMIYSELGDELKCFNTKDGIGSSLFKKAGYRLVMISSGINKELIRRRGDFLNFDYISVGKEPKAERAKTIMEELKIDFGDIIYMGDDINDLELMNQCAFKICPKDAHENVKNIADVVLDSKGGEGCLRELTDMILGE